MQLHIYMYMYIYIVYHLVTLRVIEIECINCLSGADGTDLLGVSIFLTAQHQIGEDEDWRSRLPV